MPKTRYLHVHADSYSIAESSLKLRARKLPNRVDRKNIAESTLMPMGIRYLPLHVDRYITAESTLNALCLKLHLYIHYNVLSDFQGLGPIRPLHPYRINAKWMYLFTSA